MALLPQNPRDQRLVIVGVLALALVAVYQQLYWAPKNQELNTLETHLTTLDSMNRVAKAEVAKGNATKMKVEADAYSRELGVLRHLVPTSNEVPPLLDGISNAARRAGLEISAVAPDGVLQGDQFDTYKYRLGVTGPYHKVGEFLANVASLPRIVSPINVTLSATSRNNLEIRPKKDEQFLDVKFGVQTYVAHAQSTPAAPVAEGSGKAGQP